MNLIIRKNLLIVFAFLVTFFVLTFLLSFYSGLKQEWGQLRMEIPLCLMAYLLFCTILKDNKWKYLIAWIPLILCYLVFEIFYISYGRLMHLIDVKEALELYDVIPWYMFLSGLFFIITPLIIFSIFIDFKKYKKALLFISITAFTFVLMIRIIPGFCIDCFYKISDSYVNWSDKSNVEFNGRASMMLYWEASRQQAHFKAEEYSASPSFIQSTQSKDEDVLLLLKNEENLRNVHLIVLESFLNPKLLTKVTFSEDPFYKPMQDLLAGKENISRSPVFGGGTPQAEFEILTGAPALQKFESIEFNVFSGAEIFCFPALLKKAGYRTMASNAYKPSAFNALKAYQGLGFEEVYFPKEVMPNVKTYLSTGSLASEWYTFDGDLFDQNITFLKSHFQEKIKRPIFNYLISVYGHYPFILDPAKRPEKIEVFIEGKKDNGSVSRIANQFYYRTEALYKYIQQLNEMDPQSIIIIVSDHLPLINSWVHDYKELGYIEQDVDHFSDNVLYIFVDGKPIKVKDISHFEIPNLILNQLTSGDYQKNFSNRFITDRTSEFLEKKYYNIMVNAITR